MSTYKFTLPNVRLSFPSIFQKAQFQGQETKFEATFLLDKKGHSDLIEKLNKAIEAGIKEELKGAKVPASKRCLQDGDEKDYDGYEGQMSLKASSNKRPTIIDRDKTPLVEDDDKPYAGCYVNAVIEFWFQNNDFGKRVNANLLGIQFVKDGEAFGSGPIDVTDDFDDLEGDDDI